MTVFAAIAAITGGVTSGIVIGVVAIDLGERLARRRDRKART